MHASQLRTPGKACCKALIRRIYNVSKTLKKKKWVYINDRISNHLKFWRDYVSQCCKIPIKYIFTRPSNMLHIYTDASSYGLGIYCNGKFMASMIPSPLNKCAIHINEALAILIAIEILKNDISGLKVVFHCDNQAVVHSLKRKWCIDDLLMAFVYEICTLSIKYKFFFWIDWISTHDNKWADSLSRFDFDLFCALEHKDKLCELTDRVNIKLSYL